MAKKLGRDTRGSENLTPVFIVLSCIFILGIWIVASLMAPVFDSGTYARDGVTPPEIFGDVAMTYFSPTDGYDVTWANASDTIPGLFEPYEFDFSLGAGHVYAEVIRNNTYYPGASWYSLYYDFIAIQYSLSNVAVSYSAIENATQYDSDGSVYAIMYPGWPLNSTTAVIITFEDDSDEDDVNDQLWGENDYTMQVGVASSTEYDESGPSWITIGFELATFSAAVTGNYYIDIALSMMFNLFIVLAIFTIATRFWHGGG